MHYSNVRRSVGLELLSVSINKVQTKDNADTLSQTSTKADWNNAVSSFLHEMWYAAANAFVTMSRRTGPWFVGIRRPFSLKFGYWQQVSATAVNFNEYDIAILMVWLNWIEIGYWSIMHWNLYWKLCINNMHFIIDFNNKIWNEYV